MRAVVGVYMYVGFSSTYNCSNIESKYQSMPVLGTQDSQLKLGGIKPLEIELGFGPT